MKDCKCVMLMIIIILIFVGTAFIIKSKSEPVIDTGSYLNKYGQPKKLEPFTLDD